MALIAYLDPDSGSLLLLQALVSGSAGLIVFARHLWQAYALRRNEEGVPVVQRQGSSRRNFGTG